MTISKRNFLRKGSTLFLLVITIFMILFVGNQINLQNVKAHAPRPTPMELFSIWNNTAPTIDGSIDFTTYDLSGEWSSAAVYSLYDSAGSEAGKLLIQNTNDTMYVAMDCFSFDTEYPISASWGAAVYLDLDHNGLFNNYEYRIRYSYTTGIEIVDLYSYSTTLNDWVFVESAGPGVTLPSGITVDTDYKKSAFDNVTSHRMYEFEIPYSSPINDKIVGIGFKATDNFASLGNSITWPNLSPTKLKFFNVKPGVWGDVYLADQWNFEEYIIEDNFNIRTDAIGNNNNTVLATGDINGDGDLELIVTSNKETTILSPYLFAIYDYVDGEITQIWNSWTSSLSSNFNDFHITGMVAYDFDGDGMDELYGTGYDSRIGRLYGWDDVAKDFSTAEIIFDNSIYGAEQLGYITVGDVTNDGAMRIVFGDNTGYFGYLSYNDKKDEFSEDTWWTPAINGTDAYRVHALEVANMDGESYEEILLLSQYAPDNSISTTMLQIYEIDGTSGYDNPTDIDGFHEDDLSIDSHNNTLDYFGHSIIVEDVDNDGNMETIIAGTDFVKVFGQYNFNDSEIPFNVSVTDGTNPGGGIGVFDIDGDSKNELFIGCSNGTVVIYELQDNNATLKGKDISYTEEWRGDIGASPGLKNSIIGYDIDEDGDLEAIIGDQFGQIIVLGKGTEPSFSITSPSSGYVTNQQNVLVKWNVTSNTNPIAYYEIYLDGTIHKRAGPGQFGAYVALNLGENDIKISCYDVLGNIVNNTITVEYSQEAPEITITSPSSGSVFATSNIEITYNATDPDGDPITYDIYLNNGSTPIAADITEESYSITLDVGYNNITVVAKDGNGNRGKDTIFVTYDSSPPVVNITSPTSGTYVKTTQINLEWEGSDTYSWIDYYQVYRDTDNLGTTHSTSMIVSLPYNKEFTLRVDAVDAAGRNSSSTIKITRDSIAPTISFEDLALPMHDYWYYTDNPSLFVEWIASDNSGGSDISHYEIEINDIYYDNYTSSEANATIADLGEEGFKEILINVWDNAGNTAYDYFTVALDTNSPTINITSPYDGYITSSETVTVFWDADDLGTGIKEFDIYLNSIQIDTISDDSIEYYEFTIPVNFTSTITIDAIDYLDQNTSDTISIQHSSLAPSFNILTPLEVSTYSDSTTVNISWDILNIVADEYHVYINGTHNDTLANTINSTLVTLDLLPPSEFPVYNVTIGVWISSSYYFVETRLITIDQSLPTVAILDPSNLETILDDNLYVRWSGHDTGSGIDKYRIWVDDELKGTYSSATTNQYVDVSGIADGEHNVTVVVIDLAGNSQNISVTVYLYPEAPEFTVNVPDELLTNNANFDLNITIHNPRLGVSEIQVIADGAEVVFSIDYNGSYVYDPYWLNVSILESVFTSPGDEHNLTITVYDLADRARDMVIDIVLDYTPPSIFGSPIFNDRLLSPTGNSIEIANDPSLNLYNFSITTRDTYGVSEVNVIITGEGINETIAMTLDPSQSVGDIYVFTCSVNLTTYSEGNYTITFQIEDNAGNTYQSSYDIEMTLEGNTEPPPTNGNAFIDWILENLYTIVIPSGVGILLVIILASILSVTSRKRRINRGWKESLEAVAYVTKTGLTLAFVPYSKDMFEDEQLFGGALTGIVSILSEITGETAVEMKTHVMEYGEKRLVIGMGHFGNAILLVNNVKPILRELVIEFLEIFESTYKFQLSSELMDLNEFNSVPLLVESIFGVRKNLLHEESMTEKVFEQAYTDFESYDQTEQQSQETEQYDYSTDSTYDNQQDY